MLFLMNCMSCNAQVPSHIDICDACFEKQKGLRSCLVCGSHTMSKTGACLNPECRRNDFSLRGLPPKVRNPAKLLLARES